MQCCDDRPSPDGRRDPSAGTAHVGGPAKQQPRPHAAPGSRCGPRSRSTGRIKAAMNAADASNPDGLDVRRLVR